MLRKLTEFLFEEEEIVIEEELSPRKERQEEVLIKPVEPMTEQPPSKPKETLAEEIENLTQDTLEFDLNDEIMEEFNLEPELEKRKSVMIDLEETNKAVANTKPKSKPKIYDQENKNYQRKSVLSPMHGGDKTDFEEEPEMIAIKKQKPITQVISPMFGQINQEDTTDDVIEQDLMDLDLKAMIHDEENDDEVQTSLYDFLEGLENEND